MVFTPNPNKRMDSAAAQAWTSSPEFAAAKAAFEAQKTAENSKGSQEKTNNIDVLPQYNLIDLASSSSVKNDRHPEMIIEAGTQAVPQISKNPRHHDAILNMPAVPRPANFEMGTAQEFVPQKQEESQTTRPVHRGAAAIYQSPPTTEFPKKNNVQFNLPRVETPPSQE